MELRLIQKELAEWLLEEPGGDTGALLSDLSVALVSSQGGFRPTNEDRAAYIELTCRAASFAPVAAVVIADGIGGMANGDAAASLGISAFATYLALGDSAGGLKALCLNAVMYANTEIYNAFKSRSGTTFSAIVYNAQGVVGVNIGDSRIYVRKGRELERRTTDDTFAEHLKRYRSNRPAQLGDERLVQFLGIGDGLEAHLIDLEPFSTSLAISYLITSDGAHDLGDENMARLVRNETPLADLPSAIVKASRLLGARDNASAISCPNRLDLRIPAHPQLKVITPSRTILAMMVEGMQRSRIPASTEEHAPAYTLPNGEARSDILSGDVVEHKVEKAGNKRRGHGKKPSADRAGKSKPKKQANKANLELLADEPPMTDDGKTAE